VTGLDRLPTFVTSDSHFWHQKITDYSRRPYDHEVMMVKRWQHAVREKDTILHLGDLFFGGREGYDRFLHDVSPNLLGKKFLILGNHDKRKHASTPNRAPQKAPQSAEFCPSLRPPESA
jgi:calcineurin-like phosphoesterase family protein